MPAWPRNACTDATTPPMYARVTSAEPPSKRESLAGRWATWPRLASDDRSAGRILPPREPAARPRDQDQANHRRDHCEDQQQLAGRRQLEGSGQAAARQGEEDRYQG